jgi:hypothetical protein
MDSQRNRGTKKEKKENVEDNYRSAAGLLFFSFVSSLVGVSL